MDTSLQHDAFMPRPPRGLGKGALLAVLVHVLLIVVLAIGVNWKVREPEGVQAELWSAVPQTAAPAAHQAPTPVAKPTPPQPVTPPAAAPPVAAPPPVQRRAEPVAKPAPPPPIDPQIAIEKAKREQVKREQAQQLAEERDALKRERLKQEAAKQQAAKEAARLEKAQHDKLAADAAKQQAAQRQQQQQQQQAKAEQERQKQEQIEQARSDAALAAQRENYLKRMQSQAGATGADNSTGTAARDSGPSAGYAGRIKARIKPNIVFTDNVAGNPTATVEVRVAPDGTILSRHLSKSSGVKAWDDAVLRAIDRTETLPRDIDGRVPPRMQIDFKPND